jgi:hypothetical protein
MKRLSVVIVISAGAALLAFAVGAGGASQQANTTRTFHVIEKTTAFQFVEIPPAGDSQGDYVVGASDLFNRANKKIGSDHWMCVRTNIGEQRHCTLTYFFARGLLTLQGPYRDDGTGVFAITGGTGAYRKASGWMDLTSTTTPDGGKTFVYTETFHVIR